MLRKAWVLVNGIAPICWETVQGKQLSFLTISIMFVRFHVVSKESFRERAVGGKPRATVNDLINANFQINTSYLTEAPSNLLKFFPTPLSNKRPLSNRRLPMTITILQNTRNFEKREKSFNHSTFLACLTRLCVFHLFNVKSQGRLTMATQYNKERGFWHRCWTDLKEQYGSVGGLEVTTDGVDIPLFLNSLDIFAEVY